MNMVLRAELVVAAFATATVAWGAAAPAASASCHEPGDGCCEYQNNGIDGILDEIASGDCFGGRVCVPDRDGVCIGP